MSNFKKIFTLLNAKQFLRSKNYLTGISLIIIAGLVIGGVFYFKMESQKAKGAISTEGLVLWLKMDDNLGTTNVIDSSIENQTCTLSDVDESPGATTAAHSAVSLHQRALTFDGADDYVDCGNDSSLNITDAITIGMWVKPNAWDAWDRILSKGDTATLFQYTVGMSAGNDIGTKIILDGTVGGGEIDGYNPPIGEWTHIVTTFDKITTKMYVNGVSQTLGGIPNFGASMEGLIIGRRNNSNANWFDGSIDDVRIYSRTLSAEEIALHYFLGSETRLKNAVIKNAVIR